MLFKMLSIRYTRKHTLSLRRREKGTKEKEAKGKWVKKYRVPSDPPFVFA
jgi:hypothetical protein